MPRLGVWRARLQFRRTPRWDSVERGTSASRVAGRVTQLGTSASRGSGLNSLSRLIQTAFRPSSWAGAMSWKRLAATWTCASLLALDCSKKRFQWPCAGLYEPASAAVIARSIGTSICLIEACSRSGSVFDRIASRQPLAWSCLSAAGTSGKCWPAWQRVGQGGCAVRLELQSFDDGDCPQRARQNLAVLEAAASLRQRLDRVVHVQEPPHVGIWPQSYEDARDACVPVDQRSVAVECRPPIAHVKSGYVAVVRRGIARPIRRRMGGGRLAGRRDGNWVAVVDAGAG